MDRSRAEELVEASEWKVLLDWASTLTGEPLGEARRWYRSSLRAQARKRAEWDWRSPARVVQIGLALTLAETPDEASKNCAWGRTFSWNDEGTAFPTLGALLASRDRAWAATFIDQAAQTSLRGESRRGAAEIAAVTSPAIAVHDLEVPASGSFAQGWAQLVSAAQIASDTARRNASWIPLRLARYDPPTAARPAYELPTNLYDVLVATPKLAEVMSSALATPDVFVEWTGLKGTDWEIPATVSRLITDGRLDRSRLIDECLSALTRADKPSAQRVVAFLLQGASFGPEDARERSVLLAHLMPSVHGSVTSVVLPSVLESRPDEALLLDVGSVILARKEKAQKSVLLKHLTQASPSEAVAALLRVAADDEDAAFAAKAKAALAVGGAEPQAATLVAWHIPWDVPATGRSRRPFVPWPPNEAGFDAARSDVETWVRITTNAGWLQLIVDFAERDIQGLRRAVARGPAFSWWSASRVPPLLQQWCADGVAHRSYTSTPQTMRQDPVTGAWYTEVMAPVTTVPPGYVVLTDRLAEETFGRLTTASALLSTPTFDDGTLTLDDLVKRLRRARNQGVAPYDLVQALLRLEPTVTADARRLDGLSVELTAQPKRRRWPSRSPVSSDAVAVVRSWIERGGLPSRSVEVTDGKPRCPAVQLPLPPELLALDGLEALCAAISEADRSRLWYGSGEGYLYLGVVPRWADAAAVMLECSEQSESVFRAQQAALLAAAAGELGDGVHHLLATLQSHPRQDSRLHVVDQLIQIAQQGRLDPELLRAYTVDAYQLGALSLRRLAHTWEHTARAGGLRWIWPAVREVLDAACSASTKPAGLADLLRALTPAMPTVVGRLGAGAIPSSVFKLAEAKGSSKAVLEARAMVASVNGAAL